jgi:hypothetical protein
MTRSSFFWDQKSVQVYVENNGIIDPWMIARTMVGLLDFVISEEYFRREQVYALKQSIPFGETNEGEIFHGSRKVTG